MGVGYLAGDVSDPLQGDHPRPVLVDELSSAAMAHTCSSHPEKSVNRRMDRRIIVRLYPI